MRSPCHFYYWILNKSTNSPIFHFDREHQSWICHILCVKPFEFLAYDSIIWTPLKETVVALMVNSACRVSLCGILAMLLYNTRNTNILKFSLHGLSATLFYCTCKKLTLDYSRVQNKRTPTFINFWNIFQGLRSYYGLKRHKFYYISLHILRGYVYSFCQIFQKLCLFKRLCQFQILEYM